MIQSLEIKRTNPIIAAILVIVVFGIFVFSIAERYNDEINENYPYSTGILASVVHSIDWLAETTVEYRANKVSSFVARGEMLYMLLPAETYDTAHYLTAFSTHTIEFASFSNTKYAFPLKLRI